MDGGQMKKVINIMELFQKI